MTISVQTSSQTVFPQCLWPQPVYTRWCDPLHRQQSRPYGIHNHPRRRPYHQLRSERSGIPSEIWVTIPKDGPQPGFITLTAKDGTTITTQQEVYYLENIEFTSFSPTNVMPGDELTITGEYLNLVNMIEFSDGVRVSKDDFISQDRYCIKVKVPEMRPPAGSVFTLLI